MMNNYIRGGQLFLHKMRMLNQVWDKSLIASFFVALIITSYLTYDQYAKLDYAAGITYVKAITVIQVDKAFSKNGTSKITAASNKGIYAKSMTAKDVLSHKGFKAKYNEISSTLVKSTLLMLGVMLGIFTFVILIWTKFGKLAGEKDIIKGGKILNAKDVARFLNKAHKASHFIVGGAPLVKDSETSHILITGTTGSGKTTCMNEILPQIRKNNQPAIVIDCNGSMTQKYYDSSRGDMIIGSYNDPLSDECCSWDFWEDAADEHNLAIIANSLFADKGGGYDEMWNNSAKQFFKDAVKYVMKEAIAQGAEPSMKSLYQLLAHDSLSDVAKKLKGYASASILDPKNDKTAMSVRTNTIAFIDWMENFHETDNKCSISKWFSQLVQNKENPAKISGRWFFLRSFPKQRVALRSFHSMLLDLSINHLMELGEDPDRRIWMIIDELPALKKLPSLSMALSEFRKYGGCIMASVQSPHQLFDIYGQNMAYSMLDQFNTKFIFRTDEHNFASYLCKGFGDIEYKESSENYSYGAHEMRDGVSFSMLEKKKALLSPADLANLANLEAYMKLPESEIRLAKIKVSH